MAILKIAYNAYSAYGGRPGGCIHHHHHLFAQTEQYKLQM